MPDIRKEPRHYVEVGAEELLRGAWMPHETYARATESLIVVATDAVIVDSREKHFWLARRIRKPAEGLLWWMGGTLLRGNEARAGMAATFFRETALRVEPERFTFVDMVRYWWNDRAQDPQDLGIDYLAYTYCVELSPEERDMVAVNLDPEEYERAFGLEELDRSGLVLAKVHPVILDIYDQIFPAE